MTDTPRGTRALKRKIRPMTPGVSSGARLRAYLAGICLSCGMFGLGWRAWALQVEDNEHYRALADRQHEMTIAIPAPRGAIRDRNGEPLAVSADAESVWANPQDIHDVTASAEQLSKLLGVDAAVLEDRLGSGRKFAWLDRHVDPAVARAVREAKIPGVAIAREPKRWYPSGAIAGPVIGRADIDGKGLDGVELAMNEYLTGTKVASHAVRDARGHRTFADGLARPEPGGTVTLTLDRNIQAIAETTLSQAVIDNQARSGTAVVLEVGTGHVLGMATYPVYDPNRPEHVGTARNRPVTDSFEAGSVMKMFTVAAALDDGIVKPTTMFDLTHGVMSFPHSRPITDVHFEGNLDVAGIVKRSSNVGAAKIALRMGRDALSKALHEYGFGKRTGIELPGEQPGLMRPGNTWRDRELATIAFGYGVTVTPVQIAAALAAIGSDGVYHAPRIVDTVVRDGTVVYRGDGGSRRILSSKTAAQMRTILRSVFEGGELNGTAASVVVPGFVCGGKTGTANKWDPHTKQYSRHHYLASFAGLAPIDNPRLAIVVIIDDPVAGKHYGGEVSGPVFATIASEALRYLGVPGASLQCPPRERGPKPTIIPPRTCTIPAPKS